jgi:4-oxalomesaconate tautomerase
VQKAIPCMIMRGGTSKGAYFLASDMPTDPAIRDSVLLATMGSPDDRQIDGIGGAHPLTSKVAIVSRSTEPGIDIDFLFAQVSVAEAKVDTTPNCGNILAGVGPFALERGLVSATGDVTKVSVRTLNTGTVAELEVRTPGGRVSYDGDARIDGVPGTSAPIPISFIDAEGSVCGSLLPTGNVVDQVDGINVTCIDNGMPVVIINAGAFGKTGHETPAELMADESMRARIEALRLKVGPMMNLGDVNNKVIPKMVLVSRPAAGGHVATRSFIPHECHSAIGVFAAVSVATACIFPGSPAHEVANIPDSALKLLSVEHPTGEFSVRLEVDSTGAMPVVVRAGLLRTARALMDGAVLVPEKILQIN